MFCIFKGTSILELTYVMRLRFCRVIASDSSHILPSRVPFPGEPLCTGFPEKKPRNAGRLSLKHLPVLRGLPAPAGAVAAPLHPCAGAPRKLLTGAESEPGQLVPRELGPSPGVPLLVVKREVFSSWFETPSLVLCEAFRVDTCFTCTEIIHLSYTVRLAT